MRIRREVMWMDICEVAAKRSTCSRGNIGALIIKDNDVVSIGYNGPPSGEPHCAGKDCILHPVTKGCLRSDHAERNAINRAKQKLKVSRLYGYHLYCTSAPCEDCAQYIIDTDIKCLYYRNPYRNTEGMKVLLHNVFTYVYRVTPAGFIISERSGEIVESPA